MIRYSKNSVCTILYWWGGINRLVLPKASIYFVVATAIYIFQVHYDIEFYTRNESFQDTVKGILSFLVFLLVFRLNQCMSRHYAAYALITDLFYGLERLMLDFCVHLNGDDNEGVPGLPPVKAEKGGKGKGKGGEEDEEPDPSSPWTMNCMAIAAKVNCIRLVLAYAVSMILHFQLLDAASDAAGEVDELGIKQIIFLYCRLRSLLHEEEMMLMDQSLSVLVDSTPGLEVKFRAEASRYRVLEDAYCDQLLGYPEADRPSGGVAIAPAPKVVMSMLVQALLRPSDRPWGYQSRLYNLFARITLKLVNDSMHLESIIMSPTPLPYLQHCRVLFLIFSVVFPMSMDTSKGFFDNVLLPLMIFWAIMGFEMLSGVLENPLGNDETDMNIYEKIHTLEVNAEQIFNSTECLKPGLHYALHKTENIVLGERHPPPHPTVRSHALDPTKSFRSYFRWVPLPTTVLSDLMDSHGEVENLHELWLNFRACLSSFSLRQMLRQSLYRRKGGRLYEPVNTGDSSKEERPPPIVDFNKDPNYFCHYLEFTGAADVAAPSVPFERMGDGCSVPQSQGRVWRNRVMDLLRDHPAQRLLKVLNSEDTERSLMMQTPRSSRTSGLTPVCGGWETLS